MLDSTEKVHRYLINEAKVGFVPFSYFGASETSPWYRLSVGTCAQDEVPMVMQQLHDALAKLG